MIVTGDDRLARMTTFDSSEQSTPPIAMDAAVISTVSEDDQPPAISTDTLKKLLPGLTVSYGSDGSLIVTVPSQIVKGLGSSHLLLIRLFTTTEAESPMSTKSSGVPRYGVMEDGANHD